MQAMSFSNRKAEVETVKGTWTYTIDYQASHTSDLWQDKRKN